jgi:hypothetical protein
MARERSSDREGGTEGSSGHVRDGRPDDELDSVFSVDDEGGGARVRPRSLCEVKGSERSGMGRGKSSGSLLTRSRSVHCHDVASVVWRPMAASAAKRKGTRRGAGAPPGTPLR